MNDNPGGKMKNLVVAVVTCSLLLILPGARAEDQAQKAVLITGASTGIGRHAAEQLASAGYFVYAGARKDKDIAELDAIDNIMAVRLDVTKQDEIDAAVELIRAEGRGLWGLVNNAGVNSIDPLIEADIEDLGFLFDVNVYGVFRVTKAFAPMIIESQGRIVNISSIAGILSGGLTGYGMYVMSKHAVEAFSDQLAFEMAKFGVHVAAVEPGNFRSGIGTSRCKRMLAGDAKQYEYYAEEMKPYRDYCKQRLSGEAPNTSQPPDKVSAVIQHALFDDDPKEHYLVVPEAFEAYITIGKSFEELLNLNHEQEYSYSRDELIGIMDEEWAILRGEKERDWGDAD
jgi:NAD(P)-dependent dehydrogenase (short-subunit alcohol dehydrogenase family)